MGGSTGGTSEASEWKPEKEGRCWYKKWKVSRGHNDSRIRKSGAVETAITDHKFERVVDIKPTQDCISSTIRHHLIVQDEYSSSIKKPMILFSSPPPNFVPYNLCRFREGELGQELCWGS